MNQFEKETVSLLSESGLPSVVVRGLLASLSEERASSANGTAPNRVISNSLRLLFGCLLSLLMTPVILSLWAIVVFSDGRPGFFVQKRVGMGSEVFRLFKIRTIRSGFPEVATHQLAPHSIFPLGRILRSTKLDELPQVFNMALGQVSLVGHRPSLTSQSHLIRLRQDAKVDLARPGITGLAQILGVDMSEPRTLVRIESTYLAKKSLTLDFWILVATFLVPFARNK
jgi:O-antigen biosynthesis protein WbqP